MTTTPTLQKLIDLNACAEARSWLSAADGPTTMREAWALCENRSWMTWLIGRAHSRGIMTRQRLVLAALRMVEPCVHLLPDESIADLGIVAQWTVGNATVEDVIAARDRLGMRRSADAAYAAAYAADAAVYVAAANTATAAAVYAAYVAAANTATAAAAAYAYDAADIVRASITIDEVCAALGMDPDGRLR